MPAFSGASAEARMKHHKQKLQTLPRPSRVRVVRREHAALVVAVERLKAALERAEASKQNDIIVVQRALLLRAINRRDTLAKALAELDEALASPDAQKEETP